MECHRANVRVSIPVEVTECQGGTVQHCAQQDVLLRSVKSEAERNGIHDC